MKKAHKRSKLCENSIVCVWVLVICYQEASDINIQPVLHFACPFPAGQGDAAFYFGAKVEAQLQFT
jgi:hypothetical protein